QVATPLTVDELRDPAQVVIGGDQRGKDQRVPPGWFRIISVVQHDGPPHRMDGCMRHPHTPSRNFLSSLPLSNGGNRGKSIANKIPCFFTREPYASAKN